MTTERQDDEWHEMPAEWTPAAGERDWRPVSGPPAGPATAAGPPGGGPLPPDAEPVPGARKRRGTIGWDVMLGIDLGLVGFVALGSIVLYVLYVTTGADLGLGDADAADLWLGMAANLIMFGAIPLLWVAGTRTGGWEGVKRFLHLHSPRTAILGLPLAFVLAGTALALTLVLDQFGLLEETPNSEALVNGLNWPLVFFISFVAGVSEEILFRGVLQKWTGWVGQGLIFGVFHLANGLGAFMATAAIGLLFGYLVKRGYSLWVVIVAHFAYDVILLSLAMLVPNLG